MHRKNPLAWGHTHTPLPPPSRHQFPKAFVSGNRGTLNFKLNVIIFTECAGNTGGRVRSGCHESSVAPSLPSPRLQNPAALRSPRRRAPSAPPRPMGDASPLCQSASHPSAGSLALPWVFLLRMQCTLSHRVGVRFPGQPIKALFCSICRVCHCDSLWQRASGGSQGGELCRAASVGKDAKSRLRVSTAAQDSVLLGPNLLEPTCFRW